MNLRVLKALAKGVLLDCRRRQEFMHVTFFGFLVIFGCASIGTWDASGLEIGVRDPVVSFVDLCSAIFAVLVSTRLMPEELRIGTLPLLLARDSNRLGLLLGKLIGATIASWLYFLLLSFLTFLAIASVGISPELEPLAYLLRKLMGLTLLCAIGMSLSLYLPQGAAACIGLVAAFGSGMVVRALEISTTEQPWLAWLYRGLKAAVPGFHLFGSSSVAMLSLLAHTVIYSTIAMSLCWLKFRDHPV